MTVTADQWVAGYDLATRIDEAIARSDNPLELLDLAASCRNRERFSRDYKVSAIAWHFIHRQWQATAGAH